MKVSRVEKNSGNVESADGLPIYYDLYTPYSTSGSTLPIIIFLHGFKGFKDWGAFPDACEELSKTGFAVLAMNFSHNGIGENMLEFDQLDLFEKGTLSRDLDDIGSVIEAVKSREISTEKDVLDSDRIGIIGHSRGGHTAVAATAEYSEIMALVTWSAVANYNERWSEAMIEDWNNKGYTEIKNSRTNQIMRIGKEVYDDAIANEDRLMAIKRVQEIYIPSMFIAGKDDEAVPFSESEKLYRTCPSELKEVRLIENAGHTFNVAHPFEEETFPEEFDEVLDLTEGWFLENLK